MAKVIGIVSLKGGVGKTSTVVSLGAAIAGFGKKVLLVDANFSAPNLGLHLNILSADKTINNVMISKVKPQDAVHSYESIDIMPADLDSKEVKQPFKLKYKINRLKKDYDVILIDSSPALNDETLAAMVASDELLVVATPDVPTLSTTVRAIKLAKKEGAPITGLVLNKVHNKKFEVSLDLVESTVGLPVLAIIPYEVAVQEAQAKSVPSVYYNTNSRGTEEYKKLAATLIGRRYQSKFRFSQIFSRAPAKQEINRAIFYEHVRKNLSK